MKNSLVIMVGAPGSGKDTLIKELMKGTENTCVVSSDDMRVELFGFEDQARNGELFQAMNARVKELAKTHARVYYNATNLNRKRRVALCNEMKKHFTTIEVIACICPIEELLDRNKTRAERHIPEDKIVQLIKSIQLPLISEWDYNECLYFYTGTQREDRRNTRIMDLKDYDQNNPHHNETLGDHIVRTAEACSDNTLAFEAALSHDIGKPFCREEDVKGISHYKGHNLVSAYMYMTDCLNMFSVIALDKWHNDVIALIEFHDHIFNFKHDVEAMKNAYNKKYDGLDEKFWAAFKMLTDADRLRP